MGCFHVINTTKNQKQTNKNAEPVTCLQPQVTTPNLPLLLETIRTLCCQTPHPLRLLRSFYLKEVSVTTPPRRAHSCNFCVLSFCLFSVSTLIPPRGIACSQHWDCCLQKLFYTGADTDRELRTTRWLRRSSWLFNSPTLLTLLPWPVDLPANLRSFPTELGRVLVVQKIGTQS